jgi:hypothetical protein
MAFLGSAATQVWLAPVRRIEPMQTESWRGTDRGHHQRAEHENNVVLTSAVHNVMGVLYNRYVDFFLR